MTFPLLKSKRMIHRGNVIILLVGHYSKSQSELLPLLLLRNRFSNNVGNSTIRLYLGSNDIKLASSIIRHKII